MVISLALWHLLFPEKGTWDKGQKKCKGKMLEEKH